MLQTSTGTKSNHDAEPDDPDSNDGNDSNCDSRYRWIRRLSFLWLHLFRLWQWGHAIHDRLSITQISYVEKCLYSTAWNDFSCSAKKSIVCPNDSRFMFPNFLRHHVFIKTSRKSRVSPWWRYAWISFPIFNRNGPNFKQIRLRFSGVMSPIFYEDMIAEAARKYMFGHLNEQWNIQSHPNALCATEICSHQNLRPTETMTETRPYYSANHKLHG